MLVCNMTIPGKARVKEVHFLTMIFLLSFMIKTNSPLESNMNAKWDSFTDSYKEGIDKKRKQGINFLVKKR